MSPDILSSTFKDMLGPGVAHRRRCSARHEMHGFLSGLGAGSGAVQVDHWKVIGGNFLGVQHVGGLLPASRVHGNVSVTTAAPGSADRMH